LFNKAKIFSRLFPIYTISGFLLLIFIFLRMMKPALRLGGAFKLVYIVNIVAFIAHTAGLALRGYVSGHAPWSNSYESLIYIAWALSLSGIFFSRKSAISLALTSIMAGITLMVAHLSDIDPQITNLQPVLKSHWLTIHVSVITASYGFLGLCMLLGIFTLVMFLFDKKNPEIARNITEATHINEMSMILGLCLLTVGNFLGGVWANESWGRYWGWDPKETWALITIFIYAVVVHFRFMPKLNNQFAFAVASMFAYFSVIMTYFGVNFYLSGMHSYASGERIPVPGWAYAMVASMVALAIAAYFRSGKSARL
ncbi:cytochrome c biogenesis protein CcsA, partial [uncultured Campylobacter sp.]|uniref:cytochrome c biogenesis protein n=1 Tax=uncultured Campylobacter sp. TaxID=218934 RepID=UPI00262FAB77